MDTEFVHRYVGADEEKMEQFDNAMVKARTNRKIKKYIEENGEFPSSSQITMMKSVERQKIGTPDNRYVKIPKGWFKNMKYDLEIVITGEATDISGKLQGIQTALQTLSPQETDKRKQPRTKNQEPRTPTAFHWTSACLDKLQPKTFFRS